MKVITKWELTLSLNQACKVLKRKFDRLMILRLLRDTQEYPLLRRVASELSRAGVTARQYLREFHKDDYALSMRIMEELDRIDVGRNGYDPMRVPPILPVYLKQKSDVKQLDEKKVRGRPSAETRHRVVYEFSKSLIQRGWREADIVRGFRDVLDDDDDAEVVIVDVDKTLPASEVAKTKTVTKRNYYVFNGVEFEVFVSPIKAKEAVEALKHHVLDAVRTADPMPDIVARICSVCKKPLNGLVLTERGQKVRGKYPLIQHMHMNCWWLKKAEPVRVPVGMELIDPATGMPYVYMGTEKGGWKEKKHEEQQSLPLGTNGAEGISGTKNQQPATLVPVTSAT